MPTWKQPSNSFSSSFRRSEFSASVSSLAALRHPNVARVLRLCSADDPWCVLSEYAAGGDLCDYLQGKQRLGEGGGVGGSGAATALYCNVLAGGGSGGAIG